jgi:endonuclease/exonuclease/phosphatase family metal-dependent hydrolase
VSPAFRIATFNLESLDDEAEAGDFAARIAALRPRLLRLEADILCLQEVNGQHVAGARGRRLRALDRLVAETPYAEYARVATSGAGGSALDVHNLVTLSRLPIRRSAQLRHELVAPPLHRPATAAPPADAAEPISWDRPFLHTEIALDGSRILHVINLHLRAPLAAPVAGQKVAPFVWRTASGWAEGFFHAAVKRSGQALEARLLVDRLLDVEAEALIAVCGDLNAGPDETPLRILRADPADTGSRALAERALVPVEGPQVPEQHFSVRHGARRVMFDHILVSRALAPWCRHAIVDNAGLADETAADAAAWPGSFHAPVVAAFALPPAPETPC